MSTRGRPRGFDRESALRKAMALFWAKGFENTSMTDLLEAMGIASPSLYAAFGSKEALFHEAVALYAGEVGGDIWESLEREPTIVGAIGAFLGATARAYGRQDCPRGCMIVLGARQGQPGESLVADTLRARRNDNIGQLRARFARAVDEGELPPALDIDALAAFYATVQNGMSIVARDGASQATLEAIARQGVDSLAATIARA